MSPSMLMRKEIEDTESQSPQVHDQIVEVKYEVCGVVGVRAGKGRRLGIFSFSVSQRVWKYIEDNGVFISPRRPMTRVWT